MRQQFETALTFPDQFLLLESFGRANLREFRLEARYFGLKESEPVTLGLPPELYRVVYRSGEMTEAEMKAGVLTVRISEEASGLFDADGMDDAVKRFAEYIKAPPSQPLFEQYPLMYHCDRIPGIDSLLRILYRGAKGAGAQISVSTRDSKGKLTKISAPWMLDTVEQPLDILIRREGEWALYHTRTRCAFESSDWFFEAGGLLDQINTETGGYT